MPQIAEREGHNRALFDSQNPYKEFQKNQRLNFEIQSLVPGLSFQTEKTQESWQIDAVTGGGFWGRVLILTNPECDVQRPEKVVIKSPFPDPWHDLWRRINWKFEEFPAQVDLTTAQLEHVATRMIHSALKNITGGRIYSPNSLGIAELPTGFGQVLEFVEGRGPKFDGEIDEITEFRQIQHEMKKLGYALGLEQTGQIHPDNPYGFANVWKDEKNNRWIWLDTLAAFKHTVWVAPGLRFGFHKDVRDQFGSFEPTFNKIHTKRFRKTIDQYWYLFPRDEYQRLIADVELYEALEDKKKEERKHTPVTRDFRGAIEAIDELYFDAIGNFFPVRLMRDKEFRDGKIKTLSDLYHNEDEFIKRFFLRKTVMWGMENSHELGLVTDEELERAWKYAMEEGLPYRESLAALATILSYGGIITASKSVEAAFYVKALQNDDVLQGFKTFLIATGASPILRFGATNLIGKIFRVPTWNASLASLIPTFGNILGVTSQMSNITGDQSDQTWHHTARGVNAKFSKKTNPGGGPFTFDEVKKWRLFGSKLEKLGRKK